MMGIKRLDRFKGCLVGGAVGDALGYAVEFFDYEMIQSFHGKKGITMYELSGDKALISDDTQMTLFTANGLLLGTTHAKMGGTFKGYPHYIWQCYQDWHKTQSSGNQPKADYAWLANIPALNHSRAPGNTCMRALSQEERGTIQNPLNESKGCGGLMRVAPIGLYFIEKPFSQESVDMLGAEVAALTHGHELGYIPAALFVHIISCVGGGTMTLEGAVQDGLKTMERLFPAASELWYFTNLIKKAIYLSKEGIDDVTAIGQLGAGWVAEETLAIAIYCALKYQNDFEKAIVASVNHSGDSDSTGSVTGNILGAYWGLGGIPEKFIENLELEDLIEEVADDLYYDCKMSEYSSFHDPVWESKYVYHTYPQKR